MTKLTDTTQQICNEFINRKFTLFIQHLLSIYPNDSYLLRIKLNDDLYLIVPLLQNDKIRRNIVPLNKVGKVVQIKDPVKLLITEDLFEIEFQSYIIIISRSIFKYLDKIKSSNKRPVSKKIHKYITIKENDSIIKPTIDIYHY